MPLYLQFYSYGFLPQCFIQTLLGYIVAQYEILKYLFKNFSDACNYSLNVKGVEMNEKNQIMFLKKLIRHHQFILSLMADINKCLQTAIFIDFSVSSFQLAMIAYQLMIVQGLDRAIVSIYFFATNVQIFLLYWKGNEILYQSQQVAVSIAQSEWNTYSTKISKMMQFVMLRSQKPVYLSIGSFAAVNFGMLLQIYKTIYSFFCLLIK
ncbi:hypothetical protein ABEB36_005665 [Hypothenemus hampei]|uniref:Uncharacterized protein n=1 Tax=Hypothenemus hampei TaxID=57062 RepID=A0ABD1EZ12_HYPHA